MNLKITRIKLYGDLKYDSFEEYIAVSFKCHIQLKKKSIFEGRLLFRDKTIDIQVDFFAYADAKGTRINTPKYIEKQKEEIIKAFLTSPSYEKIEEKLEQLITSNQDSQPLPTYEMVTHEVIPDIKAVNISFHTEEVPKDFDNNIIQFVYDKNKQTWITNRLIYPYKPYFGFTEQLGESMKEEFRLVLLIAEGEVG